MTGKYILDGKTPVPVDDLFAWDDWHRGADRQVALDKVGTVRISTVFLGLDHGYDGKIKLFETMIFGSGRYKMYQTRASTWEEAEQQHAKAVALVRGEPQ